MSEEYKSNIDIYSSTSPFNALSFLVENYLNGNVNTATPVKVISVYSNGSDGTGGYVDVLPLVTQRSGENKAIMPTTIFHIPFFRLCGGNCSIVIDPVVGDIGLAVFCKSDVTNVKAGTTTPQQPASYRAFSQSDGFYVGGFLTQKPINYIEMKQNGDITIKVNGTLTIETGGDMNIKTAGVVNLN